jgi:putative ABC transport system permease protein
LSQKLSLLLLLARRALQTHPRRALVGVAAIAIGVAMGYAIHLINQSALGEFSLAVQSLTGNADLEIRGPRTGFGEDLYPTIARLPEVAIASPVLEADAKLPGMTGGPRPETLRILGVDVFRAAFVQPSLIGQAEAADSASGNGPPALFDPDAIFLSPAALQALDLAPGQTLTIQVGLGTVDLRIAGTLPTAGAGLRIGVMDIGAAQWRLQRLGMLSRIDMKLRPGVNPEAFASRLAAQLPAGVVVSTPEDNRTRVSNLSRAYRVNLAVLALVALFTGSFLVLSTQALAVVRRRAELALLRVLGVTKRDIVGLLLAETAVMGAMGSAMGLALGYGLATVALARFGGDLGGGYFSGVMPGVRFSPWSALLFFLLGLGAALAGSMAPAIEAAQAQPAAALKAGDEESALRKIRPPWLGLLLIAMGLGASAAKPIAGLPLAGYVAIALLLIGGIVLVPFLVHTLFSRLPRARHPALHLALAQLAGAPGRASLALAGIVASFSLMVAMAIMVASFRDSVDQWLAHVLPADLYVRAAGSGDTGFFKPEDRERMRAITGVARAEFLRANQLTLDARRAPVTLLARPIDPNNPSARLPLTGSVAAYDKAGPPPIWVSEAMVDLYDFSVGKTVALPLAGGRHTFMIAGVWRDYVRQHGSIVMVEADYRRITGDSLASDAALWLAPGSDSSQVIERIRAALPGSERLEFAEPGEIRARSLRIFDRSFAITYLLELVAVVIGLAGVAASFGAQALARAREFGMLRHVGMTRREIGVMLAAEGGLLALLGIALGLLLGGLVSLILIHVVNPQSFHWTMDMHVPWLPLAAGAAGLLIAASLTALASGRQAMSSGVIRVVREDW